MAPRKTIKKSAAAETAASEKTEEEARPMTSAEIFKAVKAAKTPQEAMSLQGDMARALAREVGEVREAFADTLRKILAKAKIPNPPTGAEIEGFTVTYVTGDDGKVSSKLDLLGSRRSSPTKARSAGSRQTSGFMVTGPNGFAQDTGSYSGAAAAAKAAVGQSGAVNGKVAWFSSANVSIKTHLASGKRVATGSQWFGRFAGEEFTLTVNR